MVFNEWRVAARRAAARSAIVPLVVCLTLILCRSSARAWNYDEHSEVGRTAYKEACQQIRAEMSEAFLHQLERASTVSFDMLMGLDWTALAQLSRYAIACDTDDTRATVYGQACAIAGDHLASPDEFFEAVAGRKVLSFTHYAELALVNEAHFHPDAPRQWRSHFADAIELALSASRLDGIASWDKFEHAFYKHAFSSHFLQDTFAAGHMGFNRPGSSAAAAQAFHDYWNKLGRDVENGFDQTWHTFGDNYLDNQSADGQRSKNMVVATDTSSVIALLRAFVEGRRDSAIELSIAYSIPNRIRIPQRKLITVFDMWRGDGGYSKEGEIQPLTAVFRPALGSIRVEAASFGAGSVLSPAEYSIGVTAGFLLSFPFFRLPSIRVPIRIYLAIGVARDLYGGGGQAVAEAEYAIPMGFSGEGLLTHEALIGFTELLGFGGSKSGLLLHLSYRMNIEFGKTYVRLQVGPALLAYFPTETPQFGWIASVGLGHVFAAQGGGLY